MSSPKFDIIFRGDIVLGHQLGEVKLKLQQLFKADAAKIDALFNGRPVPLKRGLDEASAQKYRAALIQAGAMVELKPADEVGAQAVPAAPGASAVSRAATSPLTQPKSLAERLASAEAPTAPSRMPSSAPPIISPTIPAPSVSTSPAAQVAPNWTIAAAGADLLNASERTVVAPLEVDVSAISLRPAEGNLLDLSEQKPPAVAPVLVPDFGVAELGSALISAQEKHALPIMEITLEDWEIAAAGSDLLNPEERPKAPVAKVAPNDFGLAPAGSDLGQLKADVKPLNPDISGLRLVDNTN